jgi:hypothetical protein
MRWAARLYPPHWRKRYGAEFAALLEQIEPRAGDVLDVVRGAFQMQLRSFRFRKLTLALGLAGALIAAVIAIRTPDRFSSSAVIHINAPDPEAARESLMKLQAKTLSRPSLAEMILKLDLFHAERQQIPIEDIVQQMRNQHIRITAAKNVGATTDFQVEVAYPDAMKARATANALTASFIAGSPSTLELVRSPEVGQLQSANRIGIVLAGFAVGLGCGLLLWGFRRWPIAAFTGAGAAVLAIAISFLIADRFISSSVVKADGPISSDTVEQVLNRKSLAEIIMRPDLDLYRSKRQTHPIEDVVQEMRRNIRVAAVNSPSIASVSFQYPDRYKAQQVTRELVASLTARGLVVMDPPALPERPSFPNRTAIAGAGMFAGLLLGMAAQRWRNRRLIPQAAE